MRKLHSFLGCFAVLFLLYALHGKALAQDDPFVNGSFETGDFTGWTVLNEPNGQGDWFVYSGTLSPVSSTTILPPPVGDFAATSDQGGPGSHILFQDIEVPQNVAVNCSAIIYYVNQGGDFVVASDLSYLTIPNQQARVDILDPEADPFTDDAGVLLNIYQTLPGDPLTLGYTTIDFDLSQFAGTTVRFRVAEVDNISFFEFSIDDVTCNAPLTQNIPTLGEWGMIAMAGILGLAGLIFARRRRSLAA